MLADTAIRGEDLDEAKAAEAKKRAEEALADKSDNIDAAVALAELAQAAAQLKMIENLRKKANRYIDFAHISQNIVEYCYIIKKV